jgi:hypothetical protein
MLFVMSAYQGGHKSLQRVRLIHFLTFFLRE